MEPLLFVYGTLRRGFPHPMQRDLERHAEWVDHGRLAGELFDLGGYPAAVADPGAESWVHGDLYRLFDPESAFMVLDQYEGCAPGRDDGEYRREVRHVDSERQGTCRAWVYLYNRPVAGLPRVASGDYRNRSSTQREGAQLGR